MEDRKIAIVTWFSAPNYGTFLQAFALQNFLDQHRYETVLLDFKSGAIVLSKIRDLCFKNFPFFKFLYIKKYTNFLFSEYSKDNLRMSRVVSDLNKYDFGSKYDIYISGSDQIWSPLQLHSFFLLDFVEDSKKRMSYASSFGVNELPSEEKAFYRSCLDRYEFLLVRERNAVSIINDLEINKKAQHVVDPVLLLTSSEWAEKSIDYQPLKTDYIVCYFLGDIRQYELSISHYKEEYNLPIVNISIYPIEKNDLIDRCVYQINPLSFIDLIKNSKFILTDSYHGTLFGLIFQKKIVHIVRFKESESVSQNSRVYDFLESNGILYSKLKRNNNIILEVESSELKKLGKAIENSKKKLLMAVRS